MRSALLVCFVFTCAVNAQAEEPRRFSDRAIIDEVIAEAFPESCEILPAAEDDDLVVLFGTPETGAWAVTDNRTASLSVAQDALLEGYDEVLIVRPVIAADGQSYSTEVIQTVTSESLARDGVQLGMNVEEDPAEMAPKSGFMLCGLFRGRHRSFQDCRSCMSGNASYSGDRHLFGGGRGGCSNGECNLRPLHIFTHQFQYAFRRAYPKGQRPGPLNRVANLAFPRIRYRNGHIDCHQAQTLLARRLILMEASAAAASGGGGAAVIIPCI